MYGNDTNEPKGRRLPWMDLGEVRKAVLSLVEQNRVEVLWDHILGEGHRVSADEIRVALEDGVYEFHETEDGRYSTTYLERRVRVAIVVVFELWESLGIEGVFVVTAFHAATGRGRARER